MSEIAVTEPFLRSADEGGRQSRLLEHGVAQHWLESRHLTVIPLDSGCVRIIAEQGGARVTVELDEAGT